MISRARALLTGLAAMATLIAVVAGLPVVLYEFGGSPLPRHFYGWHRIVTVLTSRDNGTVLLAVIRDLSWLAWLLFTIAVIAELQATMRGRRAPLLRLGWFQGGAARLVALAALTFAAPPAVSLTAAVTAAAPAPARPAVGPHGLQPAGDQLSVNDLQLVSLTSPAHGSGLTTVSARTVTVRPGDCLWSIAARYLGAGDRYPEIASMNYGHDMGDGQVFSNPSLIRPGWHLAVPGEADPAGPALSTTSATHHLGHPTRDAYYRRRHETASPRPAAASTAPASPAPAATAPAPAATGATGAGTTQTGSQFAAPAGYRTSASAPAPTEDQIPEAAVFMMGALAGAVLMSLGRLRRRQRQYRRRGRRIALAADPVVVATERKLRAVAPQSGPVSTLPDALGVLEDGILSAGQVLPDIVGLHVTPEVLEVLLAAPALDSPPSPYLITPGRQGMCWHLELPAYEVPDGSAAVGGPGAPAMEGTGLLPGLFTAGSTDAGYLLLDLESLQVTGVDGPADLADQVVTAVATELATRQWSGWYDLILVGFDELAVLGRAEHCPSLDHALALLDERCRVVGARLAGDEPPASIRQLRLTAPDDEDWGLTLVVSRIEPTADQMAHLLELAEDGPGGIAALVAGDPETADGRMAPTALQLAPDSQHEGEILANVVPLQITVRPQSLTGAEYEAISTLFEIAADVEDVSPEQVPYVMYGAPPWVSQAAEPEIDYPPWPETDGEYLDLPGDPGDPREEAAGLRWHHASDFAPEGAAVSNGHSVPTPADGIAAPPWVSQPAVNGTTRLEIRILGPFVITGAADQLQPKQAELVLALALAAPAGLSNSALCSMLGADPDHPKPSDAVRQIITRTRRRLGRAADGREYIIHAGNGNYLLHPDAWLDWSEFRALISGGRAEDMRSALALVRGEPFGGSFHWWIDIPLMETVRAEIVDAAETLGEFELTTGMPRPAARAARAGLAAETSAEQLWRLLMRAEHAAGNTAGVAEAWHRCLDAIEDVAPGGEPHPDTAALYRQLTAPARQQTPVRG
jgi:DNA-binding SARP family transcriptional activator